MERNLVVCCDGTWNTPTQKDRGLLVPSNVVKMARAARPGEIRRAKDGALIGEQPPVYYDSGVGTGGGLDRWTGGALGIGLTENIVQACRHIAQNYRDDDRIFLFGFSRGAYTVRSLAGLIGRCGLTAAGDDAALYRAYDLYRQATTAAGEAAAVAFKARQRQPAIYFLGVWDTVGALGVPALSRYGLLRKLVDKLTDGSKYAHGFHNMQLGAHVTHAYHALAIDERRGPFGPALWESSGDERRNAEQVWFAGVHSNIGGGYIDAGLSDLAFMWMATKAIAAGLALDDRFLAMHVRPDWYGELRDSMSTAYVALPHHVREIGRPATPDRPAALNELLHTSVLQRRAHPTNDYHPENLEPALAADRIRTTTDGLELIELIRAADPRLRWAES